MEWMNGFGNQMHYSDLKGDKSAISSSFMEEPINSAYVVQFLAWQVGYVPDPLYPKRPGFKL